TVFAQVIGRSENQLHAATTQASCIFLYKGVLVRRSALFKRMPELHIPENTVASVRTENCLVVQTNDHKYDLSKALLLISAGIEAWRLPDFVVCDALGAPHSDTISRGPSYTRSGTASDFCPILSISSNRSTLLAKYRNTPSRPHPPRSRQNPLFVPEGVLLSVKEPRRKSPYTLSSLDEHDEAMCAANTERLSSVWSATENSALR
ncbi:hypothetical protein EW146_g3937, partial [Bondarzewia mesenterica]